MSEKCRGFPHRLSLKFFAALTLALALAFIAYLLVYEAGVPWLLYGERFSPMWEERMGAAVSDFKTYAEQNDLSGREAARIQGWQKVSIGTKAMLLLLAEHF